MKKYTCKDCVESIEDCACLEATVDIPVSEIHLEDIFDEEKQAAVKDIVHQHKILKGLKLINPLHLQMTESGYGEFPDSFKLTERGIQFIIEQLSKRY